MISIHTFSCKVSIFTLPIYSLHNFNLFHNNSKIQSLKIESFSSLPPLLNQIVLSVVPFKVCDPILARFCF
uniref:Uncharacterized protein n=1 Tax=Solanum lycopersicum TaxID=4081 RepID=A0A3Q7JRL2_SOLLC